MSVKIFLKRVNINDIFFPTTIIILYIIIHCELSYNIGILLLNFFLTIDLGTRKSKCGRSLFYIS